MSLSCFSTTYGLATALRRIGVVALLLTGSAVMAQTGEKVADGKPNEIKVGDYHVLTIEPAYDIRMSDAMVKLEKTDYKLLTTEQKNILRDAKKVSTEARSRQNEALKSIRSVLSGELNVDQNRARMDYWFKRVVFPAMTQLDNASLNELPALRSSFARDYFQRAQKVPAAHAYLTQITFEELKYIAERDFHPAVRYHAVLMIGQINSSEAVLLGSEKAPPAPYKPALAFLLSVYQNDKQIDAARVAAILGIARHAELSVGNMPEEERKKVVDAMLATLNAKPGNRTAEGHAWIQRRAIEVLGALKHVGTGGNVAKRLREVVEDNTAPLSMRCTAAVAYGNLNFKGEADPQAATVAAIVGQMVANECRARLDWLELEQEERKRRRQSGYGGYSYGTGATGAIIRATIPDGARGPGGPGDGEEFEQPEEMPVGPEGEFGYGDSVDPEKAAIELEKHRLQTLRRRIKYPVFCAQLALGAKFERGAMQLPTDHGLRQYVTVKEETDFVDNLARQLNLLQDAANAGIEKKKEPIDPRTLSRTPARAPEVDPADEKLPTEEFKDKVLLAVRRVEDALRRAPASVRPAIEAASEPEPDDLDLGPGPPVGPPSGPPAAPVASGPPAGPEASGPPSGPSDSGPPASGPPSGPEDGPGGPPAGPPAEPTPPTAP